VNKYINKIDMNKIIYYAVITFAFTLPLSRAAVSLFVILLPLLWILSGDIKNKFNNIINNKLLLSVALLILWSLISIAWSDSLSSSLEAFRMTAYLFAIFPIASVIKKENVANVITSFLMGMFVSEIIAYGVFFGLWEFGSATRANPSPFMIHIEYSLFLALSSIILLNRIFSKHYVLKEKLFFSFFFFTVTGNLFLATGRTGQVAFIAAIIVMSIIHFRFTIKSVFVSFLLLFTIFYGAYNVSDSFVKRVNDTIVDVKKISNNQLDGSWGIRVAFWIATYDSFKENPFGSGLGNYKEAIKKQIVEKKYKFLNNHSVDFMLHSHPHNQYLLYILQMGFIGLLLYLNIFYQVLAYKINDKEIKEWSILFVTIYSVGSLAEPLFIKQFTLSLFVLFFALIVSGGKNEA